MKKCFKCDRLLDLSEFYRHPQMGDGHLNKCKQCSRQDNLANRAGRIDYYRAYDRARGSRGNAAVWRKKHPGTNAAHSKVSHAIRTGRLKKMPCNVCASERVVAHHDDYAKPLDVIWLCQAHHKARHKELRLAGVDVYSGGMP